MIMGFSLFWYNSYRRCHMFWKIITICFLCCSCFDHDDKTIWCCWYPTHASSVSADQNRKDMKLDALETWHFADDIFFTENIWWLGINGLASNRGQAITCNWCWPPWLMHICVIRPRCVIILSKTIKTACKCHSIHNELQSSSDWFDKWQWPRQQCRMVQRWSNVGTVVPTLDQR